MCATHRRYEMQVAKSPFTVSCDSSASFRKQSPNTCVKALAHLAAQLHDLLIRYYIQWQ